MIDVFEWFPLQAVLVQVFIDDGKSVSYGKAIVAVGPCRFATGMRIMMSQVLLGQYCSSRQGTPWVYIMVFTLQHMNVMVMSDLVFIVTVDGFANKRIG